MSNDLLEPGAQNAKWANLYCNSISANSYNIDGLTLNPPASAMVVAFDEDPIPLASKNCKIIVTDAPRIPATESLTMKFEHTSVSSSSFVIISPGGNIDSIYGDIQAKQLNFAISDIIDSNGGSPGSFLVNIGNVSPDDFLEATLFAFQIMIL